jgi:hypothetical protein
MKSKILRQKMYLFALVVTTALSSYAQQHFTQTCDTTNNGGRVANRECNNSCTLIYSPLLNENAILLVTPLTGSLNPHLLGVWYKKVNGIWYWCIVNQDAVRMPPLSQFSVEYYANPDPNYQFVHYAYPTGSNRSLTVYNSYIDNPKLNNNPKANFRYIARGNGTNMYPVKFKYDAAAHKWYMFNNTTPHKAFDGEAAYNIVINPTDAFGKSDVIIDTAHPKIITPPGKTTPVPTHTIQRKPKIPVDSIHKKKIPLSIHTLPDKPAMNDSSSSPGMV